MANTGGREITSPLGFEVIWNGGHGLDAITARPGLRPQRPARVHHCALGHGIPTFHAGWFFRTSPGWGLWARGARNYAKGGIHALDGVVETDSPPFPPP
jgi:hypothetical protein